MDEVRDSIGDGGGVSSPPAAERPAREEADASGRLRELARALVKTRSRRLMMEYLRLRRAGR